MKEISIKEFVQGNKRLYKVTKRIPELSVSETKLFDNKGDAEKQLNEWLD